ncbi:DUF7443 domain-containing protein [Klebsiella pneumoniae]|uniref:DUF7443 domain-containing protein n=1 Tax=Klebsiella pneumoniae TaxID=573 RepID=UPI0025A28B5A|nr:hypothetical protein [Klebsiella pneumoniae]
MPQRKVVQTVIVFRDGQRIRPAIGEIFNFTQKELEAINSMNPGALDRPIIEVDAEEQAAKEQAAKEKAPAQEDKSDAKATTKKGGKAGAADEEV